MNRLLHWVAFSTENSKGKNSHFFDTDFASILLSMLEHLNHFTDTNGIKMGECN